MKIFKFKDLTDDTKHAHFLQIVLNNTIWCPRPGSLNDQQEFEFRLDYKASPNTRRLLSQVVAQHRTTNFLPPDLSVDLILERKRLEEVVAPIIQQVVKQCRQTMAITSFSATDANSFLWEEYGGNGNGACIAINIPDRLIGNTYHRVQYVSERVFHIDRFLEAVLCHNKAFEVYRNILLTKTKKWSQEEEIRFVSNRPDVNWLFDGHITEVTFGWHVPAPILEQLTAKIGDHCHSRNIIIATINHPTLDCAGMPLQVDSW